MGLAAVPAWQQRWFAVQGMLPGWIGVNGLVALAASGSLLSLRQLRQRDVQLERARRNQLRLLRQELPGSLLSRSELLQTISQAQNQALAWLNGCSNWSPPSTWPSERTTPCCR
jgi:hypothetical protein